MIRSENRPAPLALTMGEPAGIGAECAIKAWSALRNSGKAFFLLDDPGRIEAIARTLGETIHVASLSAPHEALALFPTCLPVLPVAIDYPSTPGVLDPRNAKAVIAAIEAAVGFALRGDASGVVTNPIQKSTLYDTGFAFPGHTEFLGALSGSGVPPVMMLACPALRVVPVTVHVALCEAIASLSTELIVETASTTWRALREDFRIAAPRLAIAGLNPHAGENGAMGDEEQRIITPAIGALRALGVDAVGPLPSDTMFTARMRATYDVAICMYHDQALIPVKTLATDGGVNVTLGLPFVRTSPDHGTALDIAGAGIADPASLIAAIDMAWQMAGRKQSGAST